MRTDCHKHIFVLLFCMSLCANIALTVMLTSENSYQIQTGTYCTGDGKSADDTYLVIDKRGKFFVYQQFGQVETGSYTSPYHHVLILIPSDDTNGGHLVIFHDPKSVLLWGRNGTMAEYFQISSDSIFINAERPDLIPP